jgi:hypothetical protein
VTRIYTRKGYVLGHRCGRGHSGNRRYAVDGRYAQCCGCGDYVSVALLAWPSRRVALAADNFRAMWPEDSAASVLLGDRR